MNIYFGMLAIVIRLALTILHNVKKIPFQNMKWNLFYEKMKPFELLVRIISRRE